MDIPLSPPAILGIFVFFAYFIYAMIFKKKFSFDNFEYVLLVAGAVFLLYLVLTPNSKVTKATNQYYKQRIDDRKQFWNALMT